MAEIKADERAVENAELNIKHKLQVAGRAANEAFDLAREAENEVNHLERNAGYLSPEKEEMVQQKKSVPSYKFIQIPRYAFTTELAVDDQISLDNEENVHIDNGEDLGERIDGEEDFDWKGALNKAKNAVHRITA